MAAEEQDTTLPAIVCLHGHGTNAVIFRHQIRHITQSLSRTFRFIFLDAPFEVQHAGPGALPAFADTKPFRRWQSDRTVATAFGIPLEQVDRERRQVRELIGRSLEKPENGLGVVGVIAFSQGTRVATGLCLDPQLGANIKFAIIICGLVPPAPLSDEQQSSAGNTFDPESRQPLCIPSVHVQGTLDPWKTQSEKLMKMYFDAANAHSIDSISAHEVPGADKAAEIVDGILKAWRSGN